MFGSRLFRQPRCPCNSVVWPLIVIGYTYLIVANFTSQLPRSVPGSLPFDTSRSFMTQLNSKVESLITSQQNLHDKVEAQGKVLSGFASYFHRLSAVVSGEQRPLRSDSHLLRASAEIKDLISRAGIRDSPIASQRVLASHISISASDCSAPWPSGYPDCAGKMKWMEAHWKSDPCYATNGVDGTACSFQRYLSEVESWCPLLPGRKQRSAHEAEIAETAVVQLDLSPLTATLADDSKMQWVQQRIQRRWTKWKSAAGVLNVTSKVPRRRLRILVHMGLLGVEKWKIAEGAFHGGPLGELVQWSDLIAALYLLGHDLEFATSPAVLKRKISAMPSQSCPNGNSDLFALIFTDIAGLKQFRTAIGPSNMQKILCRFRIVDSFGTEPSFNLKDFRPPGMTGEWGQSWGNWNLHLRQFMTMFPHTPDNSFLGFVVEHSTVLGKPLPEKKEKKIALVYGKELDMWVNQGDYLKVISKYFEVHATIGNTKEGAVNRGVVVPKFVHDHGVLDAAGIQALLRKTWLFVGIGQPYEGPAALEAMANGCVFLNPRFDPPRNRLNHRFFKGKPTLRKVTSQHPYQEVFVGKPHVYTVDISNLQKVEETVKEIVNLEPPVPSLPFEFTSEGFLVRLNAYLKHQDFCNRNREIWPPADQLKLFVGDENADCKSTCQKMGFVCEPEYFPLINTKETFEKAGVKCSTFSDGKEIQAPSFDSSSRACLLQNEKLLFGCVGEKEDHARLCPCRSFAKGQVALCEKCT